MTTPNADNTVAGSNVPHTGSDQEDRAAKQAVFVFPFIIIAAFFSDFWHPTPYPSWFRM